MSPPQELYDPLFCNFRHLHKWTAKSTASSSGPLAASKMSVSPPDLVATRPSSQRPEELYPNGRFLYLPIEIRLLISQHCLDIPRVIAIEVVPDANHRSRKILYGQQS
jgi:hypothetical protein